MSQYSDILAALNADAAALTENDVALVLDPAASEDMKAAAVIKMEQIVANYQAVLQSGDLNALHKLLERGEE